MRTFLERMSRAARLRSISRLACAGVLATTALLAGCGASAPVVVTPRHVEAYGTASFEAPREAVFRACLLALQMSGHRIAAAESSLGLVVTWPDGRESPGRKPRHGYVVELRGSPDGRVTVVATPGAGDEHASLRHAAPRWWELGGERAAWERLFGDIRDLIERGTRAREAR